jgi:hypothetical protein
MTTDAAEQQANFRPYPPPSNLSTVLARVRSRNLPDRIDAEYLRDANIPEGTLNRTLSAARFLGLIEQGGAPTQALRSIQTSTDEEYRSILANLIREAYADVFGPINVAEDGQERILNFFRRYMPASQRVRMVTFFLGMCREAGIPTLDVPRQRAMSGPRPSKPLVARTVPGAAVKKAVYVTRGAQATYAGGGAGTALTALIDSLPAPGSPLSDARRQQWLKMAEATLGFVYPETEASPLRDDDEPSPTDRD